MTRRNRFRPGLAAREPSILPRSAPGEGVGAGDGLLQLGGEPGTDGGVAFCLVRVVADDEPVSVVAEADFLDLQVVPHCLVASLAGQGGLDLGGAGAELLPDDVPAAALHQDAAVLLGGEAAQPEDNPSPQTSSWNPRSPPPAPWSAASRASHGFACLIGWIASTVMAIAGKTRLIHSGDSSTHHQDQVITPLSLSATGRNTAVADIKLWPRFQYRSAFDRGSRTLMKNTIPA